MNNRTHKHRQHTVTNSNGKTDFTCAEIGIFGGVLVGLLYYCNYKQNTGKGKKKKETLIYTSIKNVILQFTQKSNNINNKNTINTGNTNNDDYKKEKKKGCKIDEKRSKRHEKLMLMGYIDSVAWEGSQKQNVATATDYMNSISCQITIKNKNNPDKNPHNFSIFEDLSKTKISELRKYIAFREFCSCEKNITIYYNGQKIIDYDQSLADIGFKDNSLTFSIEKNNDGKEEEEDDDDEKVKQLDFTAKKKYCKNNDGNGIPIKIDNNKTIGNLKSEIGKKICFTASYADKDENTTLLKEIYKSKRQQHYIVYYNIVDDFVDFKIQVIIQTQKNASDIVPNFQLKRVHKSLTILQLKRKISQLLVDEYKMKFTDNSYFEFGRCRGLSLSKSNWQDNLEISGLIDNNNTMTIYI